jgi:hypothetical protein
MLKGLRSDTISVVYFGVGDNRAWRWRRKFRRLNEAWAKTIGFFWLPCPACGQMFGGHEASRTAVDQKMTCWKHGPKL